MEVYTREMVNEFLVQRYQLDLIDDKTRRTLCKKRIEAFLDDIYDLSKDEVYSLTQSQTFIFRKKFGVLDNGLGMKQNEIAQEMGITRQAISLQIQNIMNKVIPYIIYTGEDNKTFDVDKILSLPLEEVGLPIRPYSCLKRAGLTNLGDIMHLTSQDIMKIYSLGTKGRKELEDTIHSYGLKFVDEIERDRANAMLENLREISEQNADMNEELLDVSICFIGLSPRACNCLKRGNIDTLKDLVSLTIPELSRFPSLGETLLNEIRNKVHSYGLIFKDEQKVDIDGHTLERNSHGRESVQEILERPIEAMRLSVRTYNALKNAGLQTVQDVVNRLPSINSTKIKSLGVKGINEIYRRIEIYESYLKTSLLNSVSSDRDEHLSVELIQRRNILVSRYRELTDEKDALLLRKREIRKEMEAILLELNSGENGLSDKDDGRTKTIGRVSSSRRNNQ